MIEVCSLVRRRIYEIPDPPLRGEGDRAMRRFDLSNLEWERVFPRTRRDARGETVQTDQRGNTRILTYGVYLLLALIAGHA
jgi:hypothetical protein